MHFTYTPLPNGSNHITAEWHTPAPRQQSHHSRMDDKTLGCDAIRVRHCHNIP